VKRYASLRCNATETWIKSHVLKQTRTDDALMHKNRVAQKRKIQVGYSARTPDVMTTVLRAINPEYISVYYYDLLDGGYVTKTFYVGDRSAPFKYWWDGKHVIESLNFDLIER